MLRSRMVVAVVLGISALTLSGHPVDAAAVEPVLRVETTPTLGCVVEHREDPEIAFYGTTFGDTAAGSPSGSACGTFVSVGGELYGPQDAPDMFVGSSGSVPREAWVDPIEVFTPIEQSERTGSGTSVDPFRIVTRAKAGRTGIEVVQTDRWTTDSESVETRIDVFNRGRARRNVTLYRAADCQDGAFASHGEVGLARAACLVATLDGPGRDLARLVPGDAIVELSGDASTGVVDIHGRGGLGDAIEGPMRRGASFRRICTACDDDVASDRTLGLSWRLSIAARSSLTVRTSTTVSTGPARSPSILTARLHETLADTVITTLSADGRPLRARTLRFLRDGTEVCRAVTDRSGAATCHASPPMLFGDPAGGELAPSPTIDVMFDGDLDMRPSTTSVASGVSVAAPGSLPLAPGCRPTNKPTIVGVAPGAATMVLLFAAESCPSIRYAFFDESGTLVASLPGDGSARLVLEFPSLDVGRLVMSRFRQPDIALFSTTVPAVSPGKAIG